jgi:hypothetical protein
LARARGPPGEVPFRKARRRNAPTSTYRVHAGTAFLGVEKRAKAVQRRVTIQPSAEMGPRPHPRRRGPNQALRPMSGEVRTSPSSRSAAWSFQRLIEGYQHDGERPYGEFAPSGDDSITPGQRAVIGTRNRWWVGNRSAGGSRHGFRQKATRTVSDTPSPANSGATDDQFRNRPTTLGPDAFVPVWCPPRAPPSETRSNAVAYLGATEKGDGECDRKRRCCSSHPVDGRCAK